MLINIAHLTKSENKKFMFSLLYVNQQIKNEYRAINMVEINNSIFIIIIKIQAKNKLFER